MAAVGLVPTAGAKVGAVGGALLGNWVPALPPAALGPWTGTCSGPRSALCTGLEQWPEAFLSVTSSLQTKPPMGSQHSASQGASSVPIDPPFPARDAIVTRFGLCLSLLLVGGDGDHTSHVPGGHQPAPARRGDQPAVSRAAALSIPPGGQAGTPPLAAHLVCLCPLLPCTPKHSDLCVLTSRLRSASLPTSARWRTLPSRCLMSWTRSTTSRTMTSCSAWVCGPQPCHSGQHLLPCQLKTWAPSLGSGVSRPGLLVSLEEGGRASVDSLGVQGQLCLRAGCWRLRARMGCCPARETRGISVV